MASSEVGAAFAADSRADKGLSEGPTEGELRQVLGHYPLGELEAIQRAEQGFVNDNWIVNTARGRFFVKRRHPRLRQPDLIRAQHELIGHVHQSGFPAPTIVPTITGETFLTLDQECYEIQVYIDGRPYDHDRPGHLEEAALTLARYHTLVAGLAPPALCRPSELHSPTTARSLLARLAETWHLEEDPPAEGIARELDAQLADIATRFAGPGALPHLVIHGDYYADNLIFDGNRIIGVVDYDKACWQARVLELAEALIYFASPRPGYTKHIVYPGVPSWGAFVRFLQAYAQTATVEERELEVLPDYMRGIWLSASLQRLVETEDRPDGPLEALQEVLDLAHWARANADQIVEVGQAAIST